LGGERTPWANKREFDKVGWGQLIGVGGAEEGGQRKARKGQILGIFMGAWGENYYKAVDYTTKIVPVGLSKQTQNNLVSKGAILRRVSEAY